jgi:mono/diheme cytochrome c family protein
MLGVFAQFETNLRRERQLEGVAKAKAEGVYRGGKRRIDREAVFKLRIRARDQQRSVWRLGSHGCTFIEFSESRLSRRVSTSSANARRGGRRACLGAIAQGDSTMKRSPYQRQTPGFLLSVVVTAAHVLTPAPASSQEGDAEQGLALARRVCSSCHVVEQSQSAAPARQGPTFHAIANTPGMTAIALRVALQTSHQTMPNLMFEAQEMDNLSAYILSLGRR